MAIEIVKFAVPDNFTQLYGSLPELRNPKRDEDVRLHADWRSPSVATVRISGRFYLVDPQMFRALTGRMFTCELCAPASGTGSIFVRPIQLDLESAKEAAKQATAGWVRVVWDSGQRAYRVEPAAQQHEVPVWPVKSFEELLELALKDRVLDREDHPMVKKIMGESAATAPAWPAAESEGPLCLHMLSGPPVGIPVDPPGGRFFEVDELPNKDTRTQAVHAVPDVTDDQQPLPREQPMITQRDKQVLLTLARYGLLTRRQVQQFCYPTDKDGRITRRRLATLAAEGFIRRHTMLVASGYDGPPALVYLLAERGRKCLAEESADDRLLVKPVRPPHAAHVHHHLAVSETHVTLDAAIAAQDAVTLESLVQRVGGAQPPGTESGQALPAVHRAAGPPSPGLCARRRLHAGLPGATHPILLGLDFCILVPSPSGRGLG